MFASILRFLRLFVAGVHEASEVYVRRTYNGPWTRFPADTRHEPGC
jgi:hypothetical protein